MANNNVVVLDVAGKNLEVPQAGDTVDLAPNNGNVGVRNPTPLHFLDVLSGTANTGISGAGGANYTNFLLTGANKAQGGGAATMFLACNSPVAADNGCVIKFTAIASGTNDLSMGSIKFAKKDGTTNGDGYMAIAVANHSAGVEVERLRVDWNGDILPSADNTQNLGPSAFRMKEIFAGTGTINTSDAREKTSVKGLSVNEIEAAKQLGKEIGSYKFLAAVASKGIDSARDHIGMTVQRAMEIMVSNGLDPLAYAFICHDSWDEHTITVPAEYDDAGVEVSPAGVKVRVEAGDRYGFRYDQLNMFICAGFEARLSALELV